MTKYRVTSPDGHTYSVEAPEGASQDDVLQHVQSQHQPAAPAAQPGSAAQPANDYDAPSGAGTFAAGLAQGAVLGPAEGIGQLMEYIPYVGAVPRWIGNSALGQMADRFRDYAESTTAGQVGELGGAVGSMFVPLGGLARAAGFAGKLSRAGEAAQAGLQGVRSATEAGPRGYAGVREALDVGKMGREAVGKELGIKVKPGSTETRPLSQFLPKEPKELPIPPSRAHAAFETPNPPTVGPPGLARRAQLAASDAAQKIRITAHAHPVKAGIVRGAAGAAVQPTSTAAPPGSRDYWSEKEAQIAAGAAFGAGAASPLLRRVARTIGTHAAVHGLGAATLPAHGGLIHWPLHHLARQAAHMTGASGIPRRWSPSAQRAAGAVGGQAVGPQQDKQPRLPVHRDPKFAAPKEDQ